MDCLEAMLILAHEAEHCPQRNNGVSWLCLQGRVFEHGKKKETKCCLLVLRCGANIHPHGGCSFSFPLFCFVVVWNQCLRLLNHLMVPIPVCKL